MSLSAAQQSHGSTAALYSMRLPRCARNDMLDKLFIPKLAQ
jgi:hypothetical protein